MNLHKLLKKPLAWLYVSILNWSDPSWTDIMDISRQCGRLPDRADVKIAEEYDRIHAERWKEYHAEFD